MERSYVKFYSNLKGGLSEKDLEMQTYGES